MNENEIIFERHCKGTFPGGCFHGRSVAGVPATGPFFPAAMGSNRSFLYDRRPGLVFDERFHHPIDDLAPTQMGISQKK
jgi:hypothetical protein